MRFNLICSLLLLIIIIPSCKFPKEEVENFDVNIDAGFVNVLMNAKIVTEDSMPIKKVSFTISGKDAVYIFDSEGKTNFNAEGGNLNLILGPNANPSKNNPISFTIQVQMEGYLPLKQDVFVFNKTQKFAINLILERPNAARTNVKYQSVSQTFLGKKPVDTAYFYLTRNDGISFTIKYPTNGLLFIRKTLTKFKNDNILKSYNQLVEDTIQYKKDTSIYAVRSLFDKIHQFNFLENDDLIKYNLLSVVSNKKNINTLVGYKKPNLVAEFKSRVIPDTIALTNVRANIISQSSFQETGYYNEYGVFENNYVSFTNAIGIPEVFFYDQSTGNQIVPYYADGSTGVIVEVNLPANNYKIFVEGIDYSTKLNTFFEQKRVVSVSTKFFEPIGGEYKLTFRDDLLNSRCFLFKNEIKSCGFSTINLNTSNIPTNVGFIGKANVNNEICNFTYDIDFTNSSTSITVPTFPLIDTKIKAFINHPINVCRGNSPLFNEDLTTTQLCNYTSTPLNINVNYNATAFLNTINTNLAITAKVSIVCPSGNFVIPPPTTFSIWQLGCNSESLIKFENGSFFSPSFIEDKKSYVIKYEKPATSGNPTKIYDTLYFDSTVPETTIKDEKSGYWTGSLKYNATNGFTIDIILDNKKLRYSIPNCN